MSETVTASEIDVIRKRQVFTNGDVLTLLCAIAERDSTIAHLKQPWADIEKEFESEEGIDTQRALQALCKRSNGHRRQVKRLESAIAQRDDTIQRLQSQVHHLETRADPAQDVRRAFAAEEKAQAAEVLIQELTAELSILRGAHDEAVKIIADSNEELEHQRASNFAREVDELNDQLAAVTAERDAFTDCLTDVRKERPEVEEIRRLWATYIAGARQRPYEPDQTGCAIYKLLDEIDSLLRSEATWRNAHGQWQVEVERYKARVAELETRLIFLQGSNRILREQLEVYEDNMLPPPSKLERHIGNLGATDPRDEPATVDAINAAVEVALTEARRWNNRASDLLQQRDELQKAQAPEPAVPVDPRDELLTRCHGMLGCLSEIYQQFMSPADLRDITELRAALAVDQNGNLLTHATDALAQPQAEQQL